LREKKSYNKALPLDLSLMWNGESLSFLGLAVICAIVSISLCCYEAQADESLNEFTKSREKMVELQIEKRGIRDKDVLQSMRKVPRHKFVPGAYVSRAYGDYPLPIGEGQTISQPYIVALMTELLELKKEKSVLEIGTGSGYQAAILAEIVDNVYTIEIIKSLKESSEDRLISMGYTNVKVKLGDGYYGWEEYAPFDCIIVTAAPDHLPQPLIRQLKDGGIMIIPVGMPGAYQVLWQIRKKGDKIERKSITEVSFVPFTGRH